MKKVFLNLARVSVAAFFCALIGVVGVQAADAATIFVDQSNQASGSGTESDPYKSIRSAVSAANANDEILIRNGIYDDSIEGSPFLQIDIHRPLTIRAEAEDAEVIIDGGYTTENMFYISSPDVFIQDLEFKGYDQSNGGRAIKIDVTGGQAVIDNCSFDGQGNSWSSIIASGDDALILISNSTFIDNKSEAVHFNEVSNSVEAIFKKNVVYSSGQALGNGVIAGPPAANVGSLAVTYQNNVFYNMQLAAVVFNWSIGGVNVNSAIFNNVFVGNDQGIDVSDGDTSVDIRNNIFIDNDLAYDAGAFSGSIGTASLDYNNYYHNGVDHGGSDGQGPGAHAFVDIDPMFQGYDVNMDLMEMDFHLQSDSPLIDSGQSDEAPAEDFDSAGRPIGDGVDIGVYEMDFFAPAIVNQFPINGTEDASAETLISFSVMENEVGIDYESISIDVEGSRSGVVEGDVTVSPSEEKFSPGDEVVVDFTANHPFIFGETVTVNYSVSDFAHNQNGLNDSWSFTIEGGGDYPTNGLIVTSPADLGGPHYRAYKADGTLLKEFFAYDQALRGGFKSFTANVDGQSGDEIITIPGWGFGPHLKVYRQDGSEIASEMIYNANSKGGLQGSFADFDMDGKEEIIITPSGEGSPQVRVFRYDDGLELVDQFMAYSNVFHGGVNVVTGDVTGDGQPELITVPRLHGTANMRVYEYDNGRFELLDWEMVYNENFLGGANLATGDMNGDGKDEIIAAPRTSGGPNVRIFGLDDGKIVVRDSFMAYDEDYRGGVALATGDLDDDGAQELVMAPTYKGGPNVRIYRYGNNGYHDLVDWMMPYSESFQGGVELAVLDLDEDGKAEIVTAPKGAGGPNVRVYSQINDAIRLQNWFWAFSEDFQGGVNLAVGSR